MCVVYVMSHGAFVRKIGERILIGKSDGTHKSLPVQQIDAVVIGYHGTITTQAVYTLMEHGIPLVYVGFSGRIQGVLGPLPPTIRQSLQQWNYFTRNPQRNLLIRSVLLIKLKNQEEIIKICAKSRCHDKLVPISKSIHRYAKKIQMACDVEELRGIEGMASRIYFEAVPYLLISDKWKWHGRNRRPPKDPVNALLSYGYTFLEREVRIAVAGSGLDCRIGFFHSNDGRKDSLIYDLMELFRPNIIDRFIFRSLNLKIFSPDDFDITPDGCLLTKNARDVWIYQYEKYMQTSISYCGNETPRNFIRLQVENFAAHIFAASDSIEQDGII